MRQNLDIRIDESAVAATVEQLKDFGATEAGIRTAFGDLVVVTPTMQEQVAMIKTLAAKPRAADDGSIVTDVSWFDEAIGKQRLNTVAGKWEISDETKQRMYALLEIKESGADLTLAEAREFSDVPEFSTNATLITGSSKFGAVQGWTRDQKTEWFGPRDAQRRANRATKSTPAPKQQNVEKNFDLDAASVPNDESPSA